MRSNVSLAGIPRRLEGVINMMFFDIELNMYVGNWNYMLDILTFCLESCKQQSY